MANDAYMLWLEGVTPDRLRKLASVRAIAARGVDMRLLPLPLAERVNCYYQMLTGMGSGKLGRFDAVYPAAYVAHKDTDVPEGSWRRCLPDLLTADGSATLLEHDVEEAAETLAHAGPKGALIRVRDAGNSADEALDALISQAATQLGTDGHLVVLTDVYHPAPRRMVNVNNFLADMGLLETQPDGSIVWSETLAYGLGTGQIWLNLRGREQSGIVATGREYDDVRAALTDMLSHEWRDPEGDEKVVSQVLTREDAYSGDYLFKAPDLIVVYQPGYGASPHAAALQLDTASILPGDQTPSETTDPPAACLIGCGPAFAAGSEATGSLVDVVPTLLYLIGRPIPQHVDGAVMSAMFTPAFQEQTPIVAAGNGAAVLSQEEEDMIVGRLQALGYLG